MSYRILATLLTFCLLQNVSAYQQELQFVEGLLDEGFPHLAQRVLIRTIEQFPEYKSCSTELSIRILIAEHKFCEAQQQLVGQKGQDSLWLCLAETATAAGQPLVAAAAYQSYFDQLTVATEATAPAAFRAGRQLEEQGQHAAAQQLYEKVLEFPNLGRPARPVQVRLAALLLEDDPERARLLCEEVQLGGLDLCFGQAVVIWAEILASKEEWIELQAVLETQLELLKTLEESLGAQGLSTSSNSPLAGARYWLGRCYEQQTKRAAALHQYYNVYVQYGDSPWGSLAQKKACSLIAWFEGQGNTVNIDLGAHGALLEVSAFRVARRLFSDRNYTEAVPCYLDALNQYPEGERSVVALRELCVSAIHLSDPLTARMIGGYLAERFANELTAGDAVLCAAKTALDAGKKSLAWALYDRAAEGFPSHPKMPGVLYALAGLRHQESYLHRLIETYPDHPQCVRALGRLAWNAFDAKSYPLAADRFVAYLREESDFSKKLRAHFALAESYRFSALKSSCNEETSSMVDPWEKSRRAFRLLENMVSAPERSVGLSEDAFALYHSVYEKSVFYQAICLQQLGDLPEAVQTFDRFIESFPNSVFLPQAQLSTATVLMDLDRFEQALDILADFDDPCDRKWLEPALYYRAQAQFETDRFEWSILSLKSLLSRWPESPFRFEALLLQGRAYTASGQPQKAVRVLSEVLNLARDEAILNRASLQLGRAQTDPAEKLASFQRVALLADPNDPTQSELICAALFESLPLYIELARYSDLFADADRLLETFPTWGNADEIMAFKTNAEHLTQRVRPSGGDENQSIGGE